MRSGSAKDRNTTTPISSSDGDGYASLLSQLKERIRSARLKAAVAVNRELILLYWGIGREILARQNVEGWGSRVIDRLAADLRRDFPEMTGLSPRNLKYMRAFAEAFPNEGTVPSRESIRLLGPSRCRSFHDHQQHTCCAAGTASARGNRARIETAVTAVVILSDTARTAGGLGASGERGEYEQQCDNTH